MADPMHDEERRAELVAYLDGELDEQTARGVEQRAQNDRALRIELEELKKTWELLDFLPQPDPSPNFTGRTLDKLAVARPSQAVPVATVSPATSAVSVVFPVPPRPAWWRYAGWTAAALALFGFCYWAAGPLAQRTPKPPDPIAVEQRMAGDLRVLDNLNLYQYADDLNFLFGLDQPDLFGAESAPR
jgi:anti-sigma factor RsiW